MTNYILEVLDKSDRKIHLSKERLKHIQKHPHMHDPIENIKLTIQIPTAIRYNKDDVKVKFY
jgi:hypothetical protein